MHEHSRWLSTLVSALLMVGCASFFGRGCDDDVESTWTPAKSAYEPCTSDDCECTLPPCECYVGTCRSINERCALLCTDQGLCLYDLDLGGCVASSELDCRESDRCTLYGECCVVDRACVVCSDAPGQPDAISFTPADVLAPTPDTGGALQDTDED